MGLTFANFTNQIPREILGRGLRYFREKRVLDLTHEDDLTWGARVRGSETYTVEVAQGSDGTLRCNCSCPYDLGEHCKHVVAVLHAIVADNPAVAGAAPAITASKKTSRMEALRKKLAEASQAQLVELLLELARGDRELLDSLLLRLEGGSVEYRLVLRGILNAGRGAYDGLDYAGSERAAKKIDGLLAEADRALSSGEIGKAVAICEAIIDETVPAISHADDSNGSLGGCISEAVAILDEVSDDLDAAGKRRLFAYCLERARTAEFREWDWGWYLLQMALDLTDSQERRAQLDAVLNAIEAEVSIARDFSAEWALQRVARVRLTLIEDFEDEAAARVFLYENRRLDNLRMLLIERLHAEGSHEEALTLIAEGMKINQARGYPGVVDQYLALKFKVLRAKGDRPGALAAQRALWFGDGDVDGYRVLKELVPAEEWPEFVQGLLKELGRCIERVVWILAEEGRWDELLQAYERHPADIWILEGYQEALESRFPERMAGHYERVAAAQAAHANRTSYRKAAEFLRRLGKLAGRARMQATAEQLRAQFPKRPALHDELKRLK